MAPIIPNPKNIRAFRDRATFETWLSAHHDRETELWLKFFKKNSGVPTITHAEALDVALCWGWIDGLKKSFDAQAFLLRFSPRRPKSVWSQINRDHVARLVRAGRMTPYGQRHIDAARADGRWKAATAPIRTVTAADMPADLRAAINTNSPARQAFQTINRRQLLGLIFRMNDMKTAEGRARKIKELVNELASAGSLRRVNRK